jgi:hypothetical protein
VKRHLGPDNDWWTAFFSKRHARAIHRQQQQRLQEREVSILGEGRVDIDLGQDNVAEAPEQIDLQTAHAGFRQGFSLVMNQVEQRTPSVALLANKLEDIVGARVRYAVP